MAKIYENSSGQTFATQAEAAASNTALGTNPKALTFNAEGATPTASTNPQNNLNATGTTGQDYTVPKTDTVASNLMVGGQTVSDLMKKRSDLERAVLDANKPTQTETDLTTQLVESKKLSRQAQQALARETERLQTSQGITQNISQNWTSDTARRFQRTLGDLGTSQQGIADELQVEVAKRTSAVDFATGLLKADKENLAMLSDLQKMTMPNVLSTQVNDLTGDVTVFTQDPTTGAVSGKVAGNVGASKQYAQSGTYQDAGGNQVFWGLKSDGTIEKKNLGGGGGAGAGSNALLSVTEAQALGVPYGTTKQQAIALGVTPQKQATAAQETTALYANRLEQSNSILSQLDDKIAKMNPLSYQTQQMLPQIANVLKSANFQSVDQAQRNFINATLRRESGAVISPVEFENGKLQYFALPGDTPETVAQKKANRDLVQRGFVSGAGGAYESLPTVAPVVKDGDTKLWGGVTYKVINGVWTPQ